MTSLAIISDIHGNLPALEAVLADIASHNIKTILCLGDVATFGPQPRETLLRIKALGCPVVMGNGDMDISDVKPHSKTNWETDIANWCKTQLKEQDRDYIHSFSPWLKLEFGSLRILAFHGSPKGCHDSITATTPDEMLKAYFEGFQADLFIGGHTHEQFIRRLGTDRVMNPGSVGLPFNMRPRGNPNLAVAEYALLEVASGEINLTLRRIVYSFRHLEDAVQNQPMPQAQHWLDWL